MHKKKKKSNKPVFMGVKKWNKHRIEWVPGAC